MDGAEPSGGGAREVRRLIDEHVAVGAVVRPANAATELVKIGQAIGIGLIDEDSVGIRYIEAALDDCRGQQNVCCARDEREHHILELRFR